MSHPAPWEMPGPPLGLGSAHFAAASDAIATNQPRWLGPRWESDLVVPVLAEHGAYFRLYGLERSSNADRLDRLLGSAPLRVTRDGGRVFYSVLVGDPTTGGGSPIGVCAWPGYLGSMYGTDGRYLRRVDRDVGRRRFHATRLLVDRLEQAGGPRVRAWMPAEPRYLPRTE